MKKVIILLPLLALFLVGCAGTKVQPEPKVVIQKEIEKKLPLNIADPLPLELQEIQWVIVTRDNIEEVWAEIEGDNEGVALFALRHGDYERLALNIAEIRAVIGEYVIILKRYRQYYEEEKMDYIKKIVGERTSLDGTVLIAIGVVCLLFSPLVKWAAWGAIAYGAWTLLTKEKEA